MRFLGYLLFFAFTSMECFAQQSAAGSRLFGSVALATDRIEYGISQTNKQPSFATLVGHQFSNSGRLGFFAGNVKYKNEDAHLNLRPFGSFDYQFSGNSKLTFQIEVSQFFGESKRNSMNIFLDFNVFNFHFLYGTLSQFDGSSSGADLVRFYFERPTIWSLNYKVDVGYMMVKSDTLTNYFDLDAFLFAKPFENFQAGLGITYVSNATQFADRSGLLYYVNLRQKF